MSKVSDATLENPKATGHEYDGITEYDNPMPRWWTMLYWGTFWFSLAYLFHYWLGNGVGVNDSYEQEMVGVRAQIAKQALGQAVSEQSLTLVLQDATSTDSGAKVFAARCAVCHGDRGQGLIGPNLTDPAWLHGAGDLMGIYTVVSEGVLAKGMPAWERQLSPTEVRQVVAYVGSLRGTNVAGKAPEGAVPSAAPKP